MQFEFFLIFLNYGFICVASPSMDEDLMSHYQESHFFYFTVHICSLKVIQ